MTKLYIVGNFSDDWDTFTNIIYGIAFSYERALEIKREAIIKDCIKYIHKLDEDIKNNQKWFTEYKKTLYQELAKEKEIKKTKLLDDVKNKRFDELEKSCRKLYIKEIEADILLDDLFTGE